MKFMSLKFSWKSNIKKSKRRFVSKPSSDCVNVWDDFPVFETLSNNDLATDAMTFWNTFGGDKSQAKSFWLPQEQSPRCKLETMVQKIAEFHCKKSYKGAEYWVQLRCHGMQSTSTDTEGLELHFDKDEVLCSERDVWKHPDLSTATYLDASGIENLGPSGGAPLIVFDTRSDGLFCCKYGPLSSWVVFPAPGRHVSFDGDLLHGISPELMRISNASSIPRPADDRCNQLEFSSVKEMIPASYSRLSILVNIWKKWKPKGIKEIDWTVFDACTSLEHNTDSSEFKSVIICAQPSRVKRLAVRVPKKKNRLGNFIAKASKMATAGPMRNTISIADAEKEKDALHYLEEHRDGDTAPLPVPALRRMRLMQGNAAAAEFRYRYT